MDIKENSLIYKLKNKLGPVLLVAVMAFMIWEAFGPTLPGLIPLMRQGDEAQITAYLAEQSGWKGVLCVFLMAEIQVFSIVLPGMAIQVAAGLIYGWWKAFLICYVGFVTANGIIFYMATRGDRAKRRKKMENISMSGKTVWLLEKLNSQNPRFMVTIACMIPAIPNGIIPYIAASTSLRTRDFARSVALGSWIQILCACLAGSFLIRGQYLFTIISLAAQCALIGLVVWKKDLILNLMDRTEKRRKERLSARAGRSLPGSEDKS